jgi:nitrogen regulatory protein PII
LSRKPVFVVSIIVSLCSVGSALSVEVRATEVPSIASDTWETHRSERGGFSVDVPVTWTIEERLDARGVLITTLTPPSGAAIAVISQPATSLNQGDADLMNTRCTEVTVAERPARTCLDTISFSLSTTIVGSGKTYIITSNRKRGDQRIYDRILASFRILR